MFNFLLKGQNKIFINQDFHQAKLLSKALLNLENSIKNKTVLVHQNDKAPPKSQLRYVIDGETIPLIK